MCVSATRPVLRRAEHEHDSRSIDPRARLRPPAGGVRRDRRHRRRSRPISRPARGPGLPCATRKGEPDIRACPREGRVQLLPRLSHGRPPPPCPAMWKFHGSRNGNGSGRSARRGRGQTPPAECRASGAEKECVTRDGESGLISSAARERMQAADCEGRGASPEQRRRDSGGEKRRGVRRAGWEARRR